MSRFHKNYVKTTGSKTQMVNDKVLQKTPRHPTLTWVAPSAAKKSDHLERYVEARPFASMAKFVRSESKWVNSTERPKEGTDVKIKGEEGKLRYSGKTWNYADHDGCTDKKCPHENGWKDGKVQVKSSSPKKSKHSHSSSEESESESESESDSDSDDDEAAKRAKKKAAKRAKKKAAKKAKKAAKKAKKAAKKAKKEKKMEVAEAKFVPAEGTCVKKDGKPCRKNNDGKFNGTDWKSSNSTTTGKNDGTTPGTSGKSTVTSGKSTVTSGTSTVTSGGGSTCVRKDGTPCRKTQKGKWNATDWKSSKSTTTGKNDGGGGGGSTVATGKGFGKNIVTAKNVWNVSRTVGKGVLGSARWCWNNPQACAIGGVVTAATIGFFLIPTGGLAAGGIYIAWMVAGGLGTIAVSLVAFERLRSLSLKTYDVGEQFATLTIDELEAKIVELEANQCWHTLTASCENSANLLVTAKKVLSFQNRVCDGDDCAETRALFTYSDATDLSEEAQSKLIQKRKDLYFGHIWSENEASQDESNDAIVKLEAKNKKELKSLLKRFTENNKNIFRYPEGGPLATAGLNSGIVEYEYSTSDILAKMAQVQKEMIGLHVTAIDEWVESWNSFTELRKEIFSDGSSEYLTKKFKDRLKKAGKYQPPNILLGGASDDVKMEKKLTIKRTFVDKGNKKVQALINDMDLSDGESIVGKIQEKVEIKRCFINNLAGIEETFRQHQKELKTASSRNAAIDKALGKLKKPSPELMKRICNDDYKPDDPVALAEWILSDSPGPVDSDSDSDSGSDSEEE